MGTAGGLVPKLQQPEVQQGGNAMIHNAELAAVEKIVYRGTQAGFVVHDGEGFIVLEDEREPWMVSVAELTTVCLHCLINRQPEVGRGLDLAREHGAARRHSGGWEPADP
jgi:hypothetical protein